MEFIFGKELSSEVIDLIKNTDDSQFNFFTAHQTKDTVISAANTKCSNGTLIVCYSHNCVGFLTDGRPGIVNLDSIRSSSASIFNYVSFLNELKDYLTKNTKIHKIETEIINKDLKKLSKKTGFELEGTRKESWLRPDGSYVDSFLFGYILRRDTKCQL